MCTRRRRRAHVARRERLFGARVRLVEVAKAQAGQAGGGGRGGARRLVYKVVRGVLGGVAAVGGGGAEQRGPAGGEARLSDTQYERLKAELEALHSGPGNAGRPLLLEGGLDWKPMGHSPQEMDFIEARREAAREIALAFGVPPMILGLPGDNTYSNYKEANLAFYRQTVLPLARKTASALEAWLRPWLGEQISLGVEEDRLPALAEERASRWARIGAAQFLTDEEKRALLGLQGRRS